MKPCLTQRLRFRLKIWDGHFGRDKTLNAPRGGCGDKVVYIFHGNATFWCIFIRCGTKYQSITRALYMGVNIEGAYFFKRN